MAAFTLFLRYLTENMQFDFMSFIIDIILQDYNLSISKGFSIAVVQFIMICFSGVLLLFKLLVLIIVIKFWRKRTELLYLFEEIKHKWYVYLIYFGHHAFFRIFVATIFLLSTKASKVILINILVFGQLISLLTNVIPLYKSKLLYFQILAC